jgi:hypothetical protein
MTTRQGSTTRSIETSTQNHIAISCATYIRNNPAR